MPSTTLYRPGEIVLVAFPLGGSGHSKVRPALVTVDTGDDDAVVTRITTQLDHQSPQDVPLTQWRQAGLLAPSLLRLRKLATLGKRLLQRTLGQLQPHDHAEVAIVLQNTFGQW